MRKVLVTGGCGFIGSNLIDTLIKKRIEPEGITVIDDMSSESCSCGYAVEGVNYVMEDVKNINSVLSEFFDVIFHLAADARIQPSFKKPYRTIENNVMGTAAVLEYARKTSGKVVYAGSSSFYNGINKSPYAFSKWVGEEACAVYSEIYDIPVVIARFFNVYGQRQPSEGEFATVIGIFERQYNEGQNLTIIGDGEMRRDFTHVNDICEGLYQLGLKETSGIYNLGTGMNYSLNEIADKIIATGKNKIGKTYLPVRSGEAPVTLADISRAVKDIGYRPEYNLMNYLETVIH